MNLQKYTPASQAISSIQSGHRVFVHGGVATPLELLRELTTQSERLKNVELIHLHTMGDLHTMEDQYKSTFQITNLFVGPNIRKKMDLRRIDYLPCFLSEIPQLFQSRKRPLDVALLHVSTPDAHGYCSLGTNVDIALAAAETSRIVIAQVNSQMPRVHGDGMIHVSKIHYLVEADHPLPECPRATLSDDELAIGNWISSLVEDGATLQVGIGSIPEAALKALTGHKNLGLHTELWTDAALELIENGVINNSMKTLHRGHTVSGFVQGTKRLYDFINDNPTTLQLDIGYVNNPGVIAKNPKVTAINSAIEIDLTGQVCSDSIGHRIISGVGGQMDFIRGASLSERGKPIIALTSRTRNNLPKIVPTLKAGAGVVTTRAHVHYVVTEFGIADLYGKTLSERANALIKISHPDDRDLLSGQWKKIQDEFT